MNKLIFAALACLLLLCGFFWLYSARHEQQTLNYAQSTQILLKEIWSAQPVTIYCGASFDESKNITLPEGFESSGHKAREKRVEWEHAVPAENFGRFFREWREGDPRCVKDGKAYKGRRCAGKVNARYREMEADMYNLFPSIGALNAARGNRQYAVLGDSPTRFGICGVKIRDNMFEPPDRAKGQVARASLYMAERYPEFKLSDKQRKLFSGWDKMFPADEEECRRGQLIKKFQGNENVFISRSCASRKLAQNN